MDECKPLKRGAGVTDAPAPMPPDGGVLLASGVAITVPEREEVLKKYYFEVRPHGTLLGHDRCSPRHSRVPVPFDSRNKSSKCVGWRRGGRHLPRIRTSKLLALRFSTWGSASQYIRRVFRFIGPGFLASHGIL